jgi:enhancing lycopene biosynthesis protein 2
VESARLTRGKSIDITKLKVESFKALIIPSFIQGGYDKRVVEDLYNIPALRSAIKEFNVQQKYIVPIGPSAINLVAKCLGVPLRASPAPSQEV